MSPENTYYASNQFIGFFALNLLEDAETRALFNSDFDMGIDVFAIRDVVFNSVDALFDDKYSGLKAANKIKGDLLALRMKDNKYKKSQGMKRIVREVSQFSFLNGNRNIANKDKRSTTGINRELNQINKDAMAKKDIGILLDGFIELLHKNLFHFQNIAFIFYFFAQFEINDNDLATHYYKFLYIIELIINQFNHLQKKNFKLRSSDVSNLLFGAKCIFPILPDVFWKKFFSLIDYDQVDNRQLDEQISNLMQEMNINTSV